MGPISSSALSLSPRICQRSAIFVRALWEVLFRLAECFPNFICYFCSGAQRREPSWKSSSAPWLQHCAAVKGTSLFWRDTLVVSESWVTTWEQLAVLQ